MTDFAKALHAAIYTALNGDSALTTLITGVFNASPRRHDYPFVEIGDIEGADWSTQTQFGQELQVSIHIWSDGKARSGNYDISGEVIRILHRSALAVTDMELVSIRLVYRHTQWEPDGNAVQTILRFVALVRDP